MREPEVESAIRNYLEQQGYVFTVRQERTGPDITATKEGRKLLVEVKGDRPGHLSSPATINVDTMTLLGQILLRRGQHLADDYAIAIRPVHLKLVKQAAPALRELSIKILLVNDFDTKELEATQP